MGQFILNGRNYSGITYANGCFIDTDNVIASGSYSGSFSYTATEDCFFYGQIANNSNNSASIQIDGKEVFMIYDSSVNQNGTVFALKRGQTISLTTTFSGASVAYKVYGIQQGTNITFLSEYASACYDTNEREVGCWLDGKPLYQKSYTATITSGTQWIDTGLDSDDLIVESKGVLVQNNGMILTLASGDSSAIAGINTFSVGVVTTNKLACLFRTNNSDARGALTLTLFYTKGSDVAGSGKLTPTAMPTVHYSTSEQVVGTFLGKPLYQRTWDIESGILISYNGWTDTSIDSTNIENIVSVKATHPDGTCYEGIMADPTRQNHTLVGLQTTRNGNDARARYVTIQYTKTT